MMLIALAWIVGGLVCCAIFVIRYRVTQWPKDALWNVSGIIIAWPWVMAVELFYRG